MIEDEVEDVNMKKKYKNIPGIIKTHNKFTDENQWKSLVLRALCVISYNAFALLCFII